MERQKPVLGERRTSAFNPEAAAFSPTHIAAVLKGKESIGSVIATPPAIPRGLFNTSTTLKHDSPLRTAEKTRPAYHGESTISRVPLGLEDFPSPDIPLEVLQKMLLDNFIASNRDKTFVPRREEALITDTVDNLVIRSPPFLFPTPYPEPSFNTVDVDELSASLGLPSIKKNIMVDESLARSHKSRSYCGAPDPTAGTLIGKALDTPLTANALARYLHTGERISVDDVVAASRELQESRMRFGTPIREDGKATKMVCPPPGFYGEASREIKVESPLPVRNGVTDLQYVPMSPAQFSRARRDSPFQAAKHVQHHPRRPSSKRRPRAHTRVKRTDQGPEPSAADIYPDDANWEASYMPFNGRETVYPRPSFVPQLSPQRELQANDAISWPTPAEVYTQTESGRVYTHKPVTPPGSPIINIFENHFPPTKADFTAADDDVLALIGGLPSPSIATLLKFGATGLVYDDRPLSPGQENASRYGLRYYGLGIGDIWRCPGAEEGDLFRVRPRNHEGWGGWEWALKRGWGDD